MSTDLYPLGEWRYFRTVVVMLGPTEICDRIEALAGERGTSVTAVSKKHDIGEGVVRKARINRNYLGLGTLSKFAAGFDTTVAYLIGETDDPAPTAPALAYESGTPETAHRANAGADLKTAEVLISLDTERLGEAIFALTEREALYLRERLDYALRDLAQNHQPLSSKPAP